MMRKQSLLLLSLVTFLACTDNKTKTPNGQKPDSTELLSKLDQDKDGKISMDEASGPIARDFDKIDQNKDGLLSTEELAKAKKES